MNTKQCLCLIFMIIIFSAFSACQNQKQKSTDSAIVTEKTGVSKSVQYSDSTKDDPETLKIKKVAVSFHNWYINALNSDNSAVSIETLEGENGKCKVDTISYFTELRNIGTISEKFIAKEKLRFKECIEYMETVDYSDYSLEPNSFGKPCEFLNYMYWLRSQENASGVSVDSVRKDGDRWYAILNFYDEEAGEIFYWDVHKPIVEIEKENNSYMITGLTWLDM